MKSKFNDGLRVLTYGDLSKLKSAMDHHFLDQLVCASDGITEEPKTMDELNDHVRDGNYSHVLVPDENFHRLDGRLNGCAVPVVELMLDHWIPWAIDKKRAYIAENGIRDVIVFSPRFLEPFDGIANFHPVLCGYDSKTFRDRDETRDIDVLVHGSMGEDTHPWVYPIRNWLAGVLDSMRGEEGLNVVRWKHPGYFPNEQEVPANGFKGEYSSILNRSKIAMGGSSHWRLPLKKLYEVAGSGSVLLTDLPEDDRAFFEGRVIEIDPERITNPGYINVIKEAILSVLHRYGKSKSDLQPFRTGQDRFSRSFEGKALEMRAVLAEI